MPTSHRTAWLLAAASYFVATTLGHLAFSDWLVSPRTTVWGGQPLTYAYRDALPYVLPVAGLVLLGWLTHSAWRHGTRGRVAVVSAYWLLWAACVAAVDRWLTFSLPEYFHYPQYALLAWLLAKGLDPQRELWPLLRLLFWTTLLGAIDELAQYLWITTRYSHYLDFNDMLVNLLAGAAGVMVYYGFRQPPTAQTQHRSPSLAPECKLLAGLLLTLALLVGMGRVGMSPAQAVPPGGLAQTLDGKTKLYLQREARFYGSWQPGAWRPRHWVMSPAWGAVCALLLFVVWRPFAGSGRLITPKTNPH